jgi:hypothetical protein
MKDLSEGCKCQLSEGCFTQMYIKIQLKHSGYFAVSFAALTSSVCTLRTFSIDSLTHCFYLFLGLTSFYSSADAATATFLLTLHRNPIVSPSSPTCSFSISIKFTLPRFSFFYPACLSRELCKMFLRL